MSAKRDKPAKIITSSTTAVIDKDGFLVIGPAASADAPRLAPPVPPQPSAIKSGRREISGTGGLPQEATGIGGISQFSRDTDNNPPVTTIAPAPPGSIEESSPASILQGLMEKFMFLKDNGGKAEAFKSLQKSFAMNAAVLSPYFIPLKDLMNLIMELETFIGKSSDHVGKTPEQILRDFLKTGEVSGVKVTPPYADDDDIPLDNHSNSVSNPPQEG